jgi:hypothetical protein
MTSSGLEPATFRLVAQPLNQLYYRVPQVFINPALFFDDFVYGSFQENNIHI